MSEENIKNKKQDDESIIEQAASEEYRYGFVSDFETDVIPKGLNEDVVRRISQLKNEPEWLLEFRLKAFRHWQTLKLPKWGKVNMPDIDFLVITHDHWDHLDYEVVKEMEPRIKKVVTGLGVGEHFEYWGYPAEKLIELDWWESADLGDDYHVTSTPARHFSGRDLRQNKTLWSSFAFKSPKRTIWIGGDTGYGPHFANIGKKFPDIDLAILENGQYNKNWAYVHTLPEFLGKVMTELDANRYMTVHHSKFCLSKHSYFEPLENAKNAASESGKPVLMPQMGEVVYLD